MNHRDDHDARRRLFLRRAGLAAAAMSAFVPEGFAAGHEVLPLDNGGREFPQPFV